MTSWYVSYVLLIFFFLLFFQKLQKSWVCEIFLFPSNWIESGQLVQKLLEWGDWHTEG